MVHCRIFFKSAMLISHTRSRPECMSELLLSSACLPVAPDPRTAARNSFEEEKFLEICLEKIHFVASWSVELFRFLDGCSENRICDVVFRGSARIWQVGKGNHSKKRDVIYGRPGLYCTEYTQEQYKYAQQVYNVTAVFSRCTNGTWHCTGHVQLLLPNVCRTMYI